jgi:hypothetical protein
VAATAAAGLRKREKITVRKIFIRREKLSELVGGANNAPLNINILRKSSRN